MFSKCKILDSIRGVSSATWDAATKKQGQDNDGKMEQEREEEAASFKGLDSRMMQEEENKRIHELWDTSIPLTDPP